MSTENIVVPKGDYGFNINFTVKDSTDTVYNLTDYTIKLKVWNPAIPGTLMVDGTCTPTVAASGTCYYTVASGDFDILGTFIYEIEITKTGVVESTQTGTIQVTESG